METKARLALMLPGAVSLGAYEGGALAALLVAVQAAQGGIAIDAIASASAGSITALVTCKALLQGADPVRLMEETWVELPAYTRLRSPSLSSPLSMDKLRKAATQILGDELVPPGGPDVYRQTDRVRLSMAVTALGGLTYRIVSLRPPDDGRQAPDIYGTTSIDWFNRRLPPINPDKADSQIKCQDFLDLVQEALASGSTPLGFPPIFMDRSTDQSALDQYQRNGVFNPPENGVTNWSLWCSDGGDLDNEPFGRLLDLIDDDQDDVERDQKSSGKRVIVLLDTSPTQPTGWVGRWFTGKPEPSFTSTLMRVGQVRHAQTYYEDLRRLEKTNSRLRWVADVATQLDKALGALAGDPGEQARKAVATALAEANQHIEDDKNQLREKLGRATAKPGTAAAAELSTQDVLMKAAGLGAKNEVHVEIIAPGLDGRSPKLAGEFLFNFGGFFEKKLRQNDFAVGYHNAQFWLQHWLPTQGLDNADDVMKAVAERYEKLPGRDGRLEKAKLNPWQRLQVARLGVHALLVVLRGLFSDFFFRRKLRKTVNSST